MPPETALIKPFASFLLGSFVSLVTIINPLATIPFFTGLSGHLSDSDAHAMARRAAGYCLSILLVSLFAGTLVLSMFGISLGALRIAGGIVVAILGHGMLYGRGERQSPQTHAFKNPAFFPLALPGITGPGTIAVVIGISTEIGEIGAIGHRVSAYAGTVLAMIGVCVLELIVLRSARAIANRMGEAAIEVMTRLMGFLLFCVGVQFIASGIRTFLTSS